MSMVAPLLQCMVELAMERRWDSTKFRFICFVILILGWQLRGSLSLNLEGMTLMKIRTRIYLDPYNSLASWKPKDDNPCNWLGVNCIDDEVQALDLSGLSIGGTLAPEFENLSNLRVLLLHNNHFSGSIPMEFGYLRNLEVLDVRNNNLTGKIPTNFAKMKTLKQLLLSGNNFEGPIPLEIQRVSFVYDFQFNENVASVIVGQEVGYWQKHHMNIWLDRGKDHITKYPNTYAQKTYHDQVQQHANIANKRRLDELTSNLEAVPPTFNSLLDQVTSPPIIYLSSGSFSVIIKEKKIPQTIQTPPPDPSPRQVNISSPPENPNKRRGLGKMWVYAIVCLVIFTLLLSFCVIMIFVWRRKRKKHASPVKTGISGQLQRALTTGVVPKLNRLELESACEDFSNIIATFDNFTIYKGTLSSGVEIAVTTTMVKTSLDWSESDDLKFRRKIDTLSRVNHKNYVNLLGYCWEDEPFTRMMVHEYASSGTLFEHLHVKEVEHLDWNARLRVIMGVTYCLQYMHHDLHPPVVHSGLNSTSIYLTDDFAAKVAERPFEVKIPNKSSENGSTHSHSIVSVDPKENVYEFGVLLLEMITGRLPYCQEHGSLIDWASPYLENEEKYKDMVDPLLKSMNTNVLEVICKVIQDCLKQDPFQRPSMREITCCLQEAIPVGPDQAVPQLSPLWWAELEILSESN